MAKYILSRVIAMILTLFIIISLAFLVVRLMPGSVYVDTGDFSPEVIAELNAKYHFDEPIIKQYFYYVGGALKGDFGVSFKIRPNVPVFEVLKDKVPLTMQINIVSLLFAIPIGLLMGTVAAVKKNTIIDTLISFMIVLFISVPSFIFATCLQYFVAYKGGFFPIIFEATAVGLERWRSMILPILALSFGPIARVTRYLRAELSETLGSEYMLLARTKGLSYRQSMVRHAFRNSILPTTTILIPMFVSIIGGSMVIENIFSIAGMGGLMVDSIALSDHMLTVAVMVVYSVVTLVAVFVVDILYGVIDPRIRIGGGTNE